MTKLQLLDVQLVGLNMKIIYYDGSKDQSYYTVIEGIHTYQDDNECLELITNTGIRNIGFGLSDERPTKRIGFNYPNRT